MKNKKYLLSVDSYDMAGTEQKTTQAYCFKDGKITPLKDEEKTGVLNIENYVGGGESLDYDLLEIDKDTKVIVIESKIIDNNAIVNVNYLKDEVTEEEVREVIKTAYLKDCPYEKQEVSLQSTLSYSNTLEELYEKTPDNDFAKRHLEDIKSIENYFNTQRVA